MLALGIIVAYFLTGFILGRTVFVRTLGDASRNKPKSEYSLYTYWTEEYVAAVWWSVLTALAWPIVAPMWFMIMQPTPTEVIREKKAELERLEKETNRIIRELEMNHNLDDILKVHGSTQKRSKTRSPL